MKMFMVVVLDLLELQEQMVLVMAIQAAQLGRTQSREGFLSEVARRNQMGRGQVDGYSFEGSGADFAKFALKDLHVQLKNGSNVSNEPMLYQASSRSL